MSLEKVFDRAVKRALARINKTKLEDSPPIKRLEKKLKEVSSK